ncbi:fungal-specific transcription factor domain-containing protein [Lipomyces oligophaga]|uniref:fungal-specific transcription factor domain-containing protein n=1 Tax=Lipomyces oligophaga TaxID=45792 RepID=UPI0034CFD7B1
MLLPPHPPAGTDPTDPTVSLSTTSASTTSSLTSAASSADSAVPSSLPTLSPSSSLLVARSPPTANMQSSSTTSPQLSVGAVSSSAASASSATVTPATSTTAAVAPQLHQQQQPQFSSALAAASSAELRKLKRRVDPAKRKRIALACDSCKRRKQKCNGDHPCSICLKKNFQCHYTPTRADLLPTTPAFTSSPSPQAAVRDSQSTPSPKLSSSNPTISTASSMAGSLAPSTLTSVSSSTAISSQDSLSREKLHRKSSTNTISHSHSVDQEDRRHHSSFNGSSSSSSSYLSKRRRSRDRSSSVSDSDISDMPSPGPVQQHQQQQRYRRKRSHSRSEYQVETVGDGRNTRLLWDEKGHLRYMGESGVLSFLEQSRKAFRKVMGDSSFTLDPAQFRFIDGPTHTASIIPLQLPSRHLTNELIQAFDDNVQAFDYVFDMDQFRYQIAQTYRNPMGVPRHWLCLLHFTCALGAIFVSSKQELDTDKISLPNYHNLNDSSSSPSLPNSNLPKESGSRSLIDPALFFESGLGLMNDAAEDGELWVVQAYLLMCLYYQIICKRNASWIQLGVAIRFAQALGMHRKCVNMTFPKPQRLLRQRLWRTLYIQDRFWSSSFGRPLAIDDCDWDDRDTTELEQLDRTVVELSKLCEITGDICLLVYRPQSISSSTSQRLATRLREWSDGLPPDIQLSSLNLTPSDRSTSLNGDDSARRQMIRNQGLLRLHLTHLNSIILLTRPFFLLMVAKTPSEIPAQAKTVSRLSSACVLCAARSVDLVMTFFAQNQQPIRSHLMTYFIFTAGIVLLLELFHQRRSEVESYITRGIFLCIFILGHYGKIDPSAKRYRNILQEMDRAARASRSLNYNAGADSAAQKKHISQINSLLNHNASAGTSALSSSSASTNASSAVAAAAAAAAGMTPAAAAAAVLSSGAETGGFHFMPTPRNSSVRSESLPRSQVDESAAAAAVAAAQAYQQAANPDNYDDEKYLHDVLGYGYKASGGDTTNNLSRMFLKAAANDGRYQLPGSPSLTATSGTAGVGGSSTTISTTVDDDRGLPIRSTVPSFLSHRSSSTSNISASAATNNATSAVGSGATPGSAKNTPGSSKDGTLNISPADAMSQFLMDDTFGVGGSGNEDTNMDFSFDLDMMDWINLASSGPGSVNGNAAGGGTAAAGTGGSAGGATISGTGSKSGPNSAESSSSGNNGNGSNNSGTGGVSGAGFEEAVRRANAELFNGPGGARQGVSLGGSASTNVGSVSGGLPSNSNSSVAGQSYDTVFRGLMMNAEY